MEIEIEFKNEYSCKTILDILKMKNIYFNSPCNGTGKCGKCKIKILKGNVKLGEENYKRLTKSEISQGICLACSSFFLDNCVIETGVSDEDNFEVISQFGNEEDCAKKTLITMHEFILKEQDLKKGTSFTNIINNTLGYKFKYSLKAIKKLAALINKTQGEGIYEEFIGEKSVNIIERNGVIVDILKKWDRQVLGIAIDIGTTTIVLSLVDMLSGKVKKTVSYLNSQRKFGADVISRIEFSREKNVELLRKCVCDTILGGIEELMSEYYKKYNIYSIVVSANTTMINFFLGLPCDGLAQYPFNTVSLDLSSYTFKEIFKNEILDAEITILPGISAYVGADITSGILKCKIHKYDKISLFVDIGTNGEMAIGNKNKILCLATAAGPAFEGANITCGIGSIKGAISEVSIKDGNIVYKTIKNAPAVGICGSAVIDIVANLKREKIIDETGRMESELCKNDKIIIAKGANDEEIIFNQKDIREFQLAKSAIRSGIEVLIKNYKTSYEHIDNVYIAGGFGSKININNSVYIGLIPEELKEKVVIVGNSSLGGAIKYLSDSKCNEEIEYILAHTQYIDISKDEDFNDLFVENMLF